MAQRTIGRRIRALALLATVALVVADARPAAAELPVGDPAYGTDGVVPSSFGSAFDSQGRLLTFGTVHSAGPTVVRVARYTPMGQPDPTWPAIDLPWTAPGLDGDLLVDSQDRALLVVRETSGARVWRFVDGAPDPTFSGDGLASIPAAALPPNSSNGLRPAAVDADDRFLLGILSSPTASVLRLGVDGEPDPTFSGDGTATFACCGDARPEPSVPWSRAFAARADGSVLLAVAQGPKAVAVAVSSAGAPSAPVPLPPATTPSGAAQVDGAIADPQGRLVYWGSRGVGPDQLPYLRRLAPDLAPDSTFGPDGYAAAVDGWIDAVAARDGGLVVARSFDDLVALTDDGYLDPSFGTGGRSTRTVGEAGPSGSVSDSLELVVDPDGGVVLAENATIYDDDGPIQIISGFRLAHVRSDGSWSSDHFWTADAYEHLQGYATDPLIEADGAAMVVRVLFETTSGHIRLPLAAGPGRSSPVVAPFGSPGPLVDRLFSDLVWRAPTAAERSSVAPAISAGTETAAGLVSELVDDVERSAVVDPVVRLYRAHFRRPADSSGLRHWVAVRRGGATVASIAARFSRSTEFVRTYGSLSNRAFVERVYRNVFGRAGDAAGIAFWTGRLDRGRAGRGQVMASMSESTEHQRRTRAEVVTTSVHLGLLDRAPTAGELAAWSPTVATAPDPLVAALLASPAWQQRVG